MSTRANLVKCIGLRTKGNILAKPEGSLVQALNVNIDEDGVITPRRGFNDYSNPVGGVESNINIAKQLMEYKAKILRHYQNRLEYEDTSGVFQEINGEFQELREGYRIKYQEANSNLYFTTDTGVKKISVKSNNNFNSNMVTNAGGVKAGFTSAKVIPASGGILPPQSKVAYRILFGTKDANNNLILGAPSSRLVVTNFNNQTVTNEISTVEITDNVELTDGDYFTYQNSTGKYVVYFDQTGNAEIPQTADTINGTYIKTTVGASEPSTAAILANVMSTQIPNTTIEIDSVNSNKVNITSTEEDDIIGVGTFKQADGTTPGAVRVFIATDLEGDLVTGSSVNVEVTGVIPEDVTTDYFYQVYRTSFISVTTGLTINDLDPGDESNLVFESAVTNDNLTSGEFTYVDNTPESFRASSVPLYTNEISGEGILQANEAPPIALDIHSFRNSVFYANTKSRHRFDISVLSIDDFVSGSTRFVIGNSDITRYYTFVGEAQVQDITIDAIPADGDYINLFSANDERQYYIYFGANSDPLIEGAVGYGIRTSDLGALNVNDVASRIATALLDNVDFELTVVDNTITFTYTNNGNTTGITNGVGTDITISAPSTVGDGEDTTAPNAGGDVLLSGLVSVGQAIDETARSLVKVISKDPLSPVNAYYLSTGEDLPGKILFENRSLEDNPFYITIQEDGDAETISGEISPALPLVRTIESITVTTTETTITITDHGYSTGDEFFVSYLDDPNNPTTLDSFSGIYTVTVLDDDTFTIEYKSPTAVGTVNSPPFAIVFKGEVVSDNQESPNRVYFSKRSEPEAVPVVNFIDVGPQDEEIKRILALRDNLFILKDDGVYIISGTSAPNFSVRLLDNTRIIAPDSAVVLNNQIYALTEQGITIITDSGVGIISRGIEDRVDDVVNLDNFTDNTFGISYENDRAYIMFCPTNDNDETSTQAYRYNIFEKTWSSWEYDATCGIVLERDNTLYVGNGDRSYVSKERKGFEREDYSDRNFTNAINEGAVLDDIVKLGSIDNVKAKDVILQTQEVTINYLNKRLLQKMDTFDNGLTAPVGSTFFASFGAIAGDNLVKNFQNLYDYLITIDNNLILRDDDNLEIDPVIFTLGNLRDYAERLTDRLNDSLSVTTKKTYLKPETTSYEAYIVSVDKLRNEITVHQPRPFILGDVQIYKGYTKTIEWNPQHFGDPSALKQIRSMTIMFDQNNFYDATAKFASDNSQAVKTVDFQGKGIGYWSDMAWSDKDHYWGGIGNDVPFRNPVPREKQRCRYLSITFEHKSARESFRVLGVSGVVRAISDRAYK